MKKIIHVLSFMALGMLLFNGSCTKLSEPDYSEVTAANFHPTGNDLTSLIAPAYANLRGMWMSCCYSYLTMQEASGYEFVTPVRPNGWGDGYLPFAKHQFTPNGVYEDALWSSCYTGINNCNRVLYQITSGTVPVNSTDKPHILAELKALRAYYYSLLLDNFGNVPIVTNFKATDLPKQSTRKQVYDFVVSELTNSIPELSTTVDQTTYGRLTRYGAEIMLANVYLNAEVYTGTAEYDKVIPLTDDIINSNKYKLAPNYKDNFTKTNQNSPEIIWAIPYDQVNAPGNTFHMQTLKPIQQKVFNMQAQPWGGGSSQPQFVDTYDTLDARYKDTWIMGPQYYQGKEVINFIKNVPSLDSTAFNNGFPVGKYEIYAGEKVDSDVDFPIFRYADVLMVKAEALLRTGHPDEAATLVTQVRQRDFTDPSKATVTGTELMQGSSFNYGYWDNGKIVNPESGANIKYGRFLDELGWEFAMEGHNRDDMIRFGVYTTKTWMNTTPVSKDRILFPIPLPALNTNSNLKQNPGY